MFLWDEHFEFVFIERLITVCHLHQERVATIIRFGEALVCSGHSNPDVCCSVALKTESVGVIFTPDVIACLIGSGPNFNGPILCIATI